MIAYIDGDNAPTKRIEKIEELNERDELYIFYGGNAGYFCKEKNREAITNAVKCELAFKEVAPGDCAVDLAVAMDAARRLESSNQEVVVLVSEDKHFRIMAQQLQAAYPDKIIKNVPSVGDAIEKYAVLDVKTLEELETALLGVFGKEKGHHLFDRMTDLFEESFKQTTNAYPTIVYQNSPRTTRTELPSIFKDGLVAIAKSAKRMHM